MAVLPLTTRTADEVIAVRAALQRQDLPVARLQFPCLPSVQLHYETWLVHLLDDIFTAGQFDFPTAIKFLESLPNSTWTLHGCRVLYNAKLAFEEEFSRGIHQPMILLARLVNSVRTSSHDVVKSRAETYWHSWFSPTIHAIVDGKPLVIESSERRESVYAGSATFAYDSTRRNIFAWCQQWTPKLVQKEQWKFVPVDTAWDRFYIQSAAYNEYLYVDEKKKVCERNGVFTWRTTTNPHEKASIWQLVPIGLIKNGEFAIYNLHTHEYLCTHNFVFDDERRFLSSTDRIDYPLTAHRWRVRPQKMSSLEKGIASFYAKQYADAETHFSRALDTRLAIGDQVTCHTYRMVARSRQIQKNPHIQEDFEALQGFGGSKAVEACGLYDLWKEGARALGVPVRKDEARAASPAEIFADAENLMARASYLFVLKDYDRALGVYRQVLDAKTNPYDSLQSAQRESAQLYCAKCLYMLGRPGEALRMLDEVEGKERSSPMPPNVENEVQFFLWKGRCRRKLEQYKDACKELEVALDKFACKSETATSRLASLRESIITELRIVGIFRLGVLGRSSEKHRDLPNDFTAMTESYPGLESAAEQLVYLFQCPLTLEYMVDPVITPSGNTYEREMIENHIKMIGPWDPLTNAPLSTSQLYPNRALRLLKEAMLSDHPLGNLLAACNI